jgi:murein hydrolase activator
VRLQYPVRRLLPACLTLLGLLPAPALPAPKQELSELRLRIEALQKELESKEVSKSVATDQLKDSEKQISRINRRLWEIMQEEKKVAATLREIEDQAEETRQRAQTQRQHLSNLLHLRYLHGDHDFFRLLLNLEDPNQTARNLHYYGHIGRARAKLIQEYEENLHKLDSLAKQAQAKQTELQGLKREQGQQKSALQEERASRRSLLARLSEEISQQRRQLTTLQQDEQRLTRLVQQLRKTLNPKSAPAPRINEKLPDASLAGKPFRKLKGVLRLPIKGELVGRFGRPREVGGSAWKGLFIRAPAGAEVKAVASGLVVFADWLRGFGNLIILDHGSAYMSLYSNNESLYKQLGDRVKAGDVLATVGNSGGQLETGLYFELRHESRPFDPMAWIDLD